MEQGSTTKSPENRGGNGIVGRIRDTAAAQLNSQKDKATEGLGTVASAVRESTQNLRSQQHDVAARYVEQAADQIERFSARLREKDITELLSDAQQLARRRPALFIGAAFAIGLMGARFLKSSAQDTDRHATMYDDDTNERFGSRAYPSAVNTPPVTSTGAATERY
jgi:ElaB/YqjD/DUF883 family membrane-anchored ribosome-binding protein